MKPFAFRCGEQRNFGEDEALVAKVDAGWRNIRPEE